MHESEPETYDVVIIGGAISGASTAVLLKRWRPETRILIVERAAEFDRKVGEATVEISGLFLSRVLGLYDHLLRNHLPKHGLRYWFSERPDQSFEEMAEVGTDSLPSMPSFQLDRAVLDEHVLELAVELGAELLRPAKVVDVELARPLNEVVVEVAGEERRFRAKWVVDGSGRRAYLSRKLGLFEANEEHPTSAMWGRWTGVKDMDGKGVLGADVRSPEMPFTRSARRLCTNHFCTYGSWTWAIPLSGGQTSIGLVWDRRLFDTPEGGTPRERYERHVRAAAGLGDLVENAILDPEDFKSYDRLPYRSTRYMGPGWALVGDAAAFIDPYYSPGLDHVSYSAYASARIIEEDLSGKLGAAGLALAIRKHNDEFARSYDRWFRGLYLNKYEIMGDAELCGAAYLMDTAMYFIGKVGRTARDVEEYRHPLLGLDSRGQRFAYKALRFYSGRLVKLARARRKAGTYGRRNGDLRCIAKDFGVGETPFSSPFRTGIKLWLGVEWDVLRERWSPARSRASAGD